MPTDAINRQPFGLLGFLGIKNGGRNPEQLSNVLTPVFSMEGLYYRTNMEVIRQLYAVTAVGMTAAALQVPQDEVWAIHGGQANSQTALGAGVTLAGYLCAAIDNTSFNVSPLGEFTSATTPTVFSSPWKWPVVQYLQPGSFVSFYCSNIVAGPVNVIIQLWITRLKT